MAFGGTAFPYLVLREHFVLSLPSHIANAPQPRQISIATLILAIIPERHTSAKKVISGAFSLLPCKNIAGPGMCESLTAPRPRPSRVGRGDASVPPREFR